MGKHFYFLLILSLLCISCRESKQCARFTRKHPSCFQQQTMIIHDTFKLPGAKADTVFSKTSDTVVLQKDRLTVKYFSSNDTVYLSGECRDSVIIREIPVQVKTPVIREQHVPQWMYWLTIILTAIIGVLCAWKAPFRGYGGFR